MATRRLLRAGIATGVLAVVGCSRSPSIDYPAPGLESVRWWSAHRGDDAAPVEPAGAGDRATLELPEVAAGGTGYLLLAGHEFRAVVDLLASGDVLFDPSGSAHFAR